MYRFAQSCCLNILSIAALLPLSLTFAGDATAADPADGHLRVLTYNILVDAKSGGIPQTVEVIKASQADVVGIQEVHEIGDELAAQTGFTFVKQPRGGILTRLKVVEVSKAKFGVKLERANGGHVWMFNIHLNHAPYQPYQLADIPYGEGNPFIRTAGEAIAEAIRARGDELAAVLMDMAPALRSEDPIVLTGDFNEPSCLDWTKEAVAAGKVPVAVAWPQTRVVIDSGLTDAFRAVHPDPVANPGYTWTSRPSKREVLDRIDFVFCRGLTPKTAEIIGEAAETSQIVVTPYPSDHRAVVVQFEEQD